MFVILVVLAVYSVTTPGFGRAMSFLFRPNFADLTAGGVLEALGHSFFTLSLGLGAMLTYGSYMRRQDSIPRAALTICVLDTLIAIMACVIMFSIIFSFDFEVSKSSTILFTTIPVIFFKLPGGAVICGLFYLLVSFAALTSTISLLEVVASYAIDELGWRRRRAAVTIGVSIWVFGILSALSVGGVKVLSEFNPIGQGIDGRGLRHPRLPGQQLVPPRRRSLHRPLHRLDPHGQGDPGRTRGGERSAGPVLRRLAIPDPLRRSGRRRRHHRQRASWARSTSRAEGQRHAVSDAPRHRHAPREGRRARAISVLPQHAGLLGQLAETRGSRASR